MAKITITFEDAGSGVRVTAEPNFETMMRMHASGHRLTSAHGYAIAALNHIREKSKEQSNSLGIIIPKVRKV